MCLTSYMCTICKGILYYICKYILCGKTFTRSSILCVCVNRPLILTHTHTCTLTHTLTHMHIHIIHVLLSMMLQTPQANLTHSPLFVFTIEGNVSGWPQGGGAC